MIKSFYVENYKSWKNPTMISFKASSISEHPENTISVKKGKERLLKNIAVYGANASGKSNLINSFAFMHSKVIELENKRVWNEMMSTNTNNPFQSMLKFPQLQCETYAYNEKPSIFEITFLIDNKEYSYGFEIKKNSIRKEWLDINDKPFFERGVNSKELLDYKFILDKVPNNVLFISYLQEYAKLPLSNPIKKLYRQFQSMAIIKDYEKVQDFIISKVLMDTLEKNKKYFDKIKDFFSIVDFGIKELIKDENTNTISVVHYGKNKDFVVPIGNESEGTKKMLLILVNLFMLLEHGGLIIADEMTSSLHPLLSKALLDLISDNEQNVKNCQIIFSTHDVFLMAKEQFRRDEILFVTKDRNGISELDKLYDFKDNDSARVRPDAVYYKNYLKGMYSGTPTIDYLKLSNVKEYIVAEKSSKYKTSSNKET